MCGVIVVDAGRSRSTILGLWCLYNDHCVDIIMSIWSSINCPTVICSPTVCYFCREKLLVKPTAPGSLSHIFAFAIYFFLAFIFRSIKPKIPFCVLFLFILFGIRSINLLQFYSRPFAYLEAPLPERDWQPLLHVGLRGFVICVGTMESRVASYWIDTLVS